MKIILSVAMIGALVTSIIVQIIGCIKEIKEKRKGGKKETNGNLDADN